MKVIDTSQMGEKIISDSLYDNRTNLINALCLKNEPLVTIVVIAYNRIDKTRNCIESILTNTHNIDYELVLIDNGSTDGTLDYFESIDYEKKEIIRITKNIGAGIPLFAIPVLHYHKYIAWIANDVIVTPNWLENLVTIMETDEKVGMVCPVSSNVSNLQEINLQFQSLEEMYQKAALFNQSDPRKWQDRLRLMNAVTFLRKEVMVALGPYCYDMGFFHDFGDDDLTFRIRRTGYRTILAGDTWVHHDHDIWHFENKDPVEHQKSLEIGRENFRDKFYGVDAWDDVNNYWMIDVTSHIPTPKDSCKKQILGVDVRCGTPILDVKNRLREFGIFDVDLSAFTQLAKYVPDLSSICSGIVACDREEYLGRQFPDNYYDYIVVDHPLNRYHEPQQMLEDWFSLLKPGGLLMFPLLNTFSVMEFLYCLGQKDLYNHEFAYNIPLEPLTATLEQFGKLEFILPRSINLSQDSKEYLTSMFPARISQDKKNQLLSDLTIERYMIGVKKRDTNTL